LLIADTKALVGAKRKSAHRAYDDPACFENCSPEIKLAGAGENTLRLAFFAT
jgi:hypothetical protein